ncbi:MAG: FAD-dependent oxidoreductase [Cyanobacteria bacterium]|nr:FAD-dependent oxidoreductase [Cyanobacteriota bacterium]
MYFNSDEKEKIVIIGGNVSGLAAASQARRNAPNAEITVLESGSHISYGTCGLPYYISGVIDDINKLFVYTPGFFEKERKINIKLNHKVISINPSKREISVQVGINREPSIFNYDKLVICSGATTFDLGIEVSKLKNAFFFRNVEDTLRLKEFINSYNPKKAVIIGAGSIGLLMAEALLKSGIKVSVIEKAKKIFNEYEDEISTILYKKLILEGIELILEAELTSALPDDNGFVKNVSFMKDSNLNTLKTDLIILCAGIKANTDFCKGTSIELGKSSAIRVSPKLQTSYSNIFAAGDCACVKNLVTGKYDFIPTANNAAKTGRIAGDNITGGDIIFPGSVGTKVDQIFEFEIAKTGISLKEALSLQFNAVKITDSYSSHTKAIPDAQTITVTLIMDVKTRKILGAQMIGKEGVAKRIDVFATAITNQMSIDDVYMLDLGYSPGTSTVWDPVNKICGQAILNLSKIKF